MDGLESMASRRNVLWANLPPDKGLRKNPRYTRLVKPIRSRSIDGLGKVRHASCAYRTSTALSLIAFLTVALLMACAVVPASVWAADSDAGATQEVEENIQGCVDAIRSSRGIASDQSLLASDAMSPGDSTSDWIAYDFARVQCDTGTATYLDRLQKSVTDRYVNTDILLDRFMSTEWNRTTIVVVGLKGDPTACGTDAAGAPVNLVADGCYNWVRDNDIAAQGTNGLVYAIEALDASGVIAPADARYTEDSLIGSLLDAQSPDGGFGLYRNASDVDVTAMAICALAPHANDGEVGAAIDRALDYLSSQQGDDGAFLSGGVANSESCSQVVMALSALQLNPKTDARFVKNGQSVYDALMSFKRDDGSFSHASDDDLSRVELLATEQATRALISMDELARGGDGNVYTADVSLSLGSKSTGASSAENDSPLPWLLGGIGIGAAIVAVMLIASRKRRRHEA